MAKRFIVSIDEIRQNFVFGEDFDGTYSKTVTLSDGTTRTIELTPVMRDGMPMVELNDTGHRTYMGFHGTTVNGTLMVQIHDLDAAWTKRGASAPQSQTLPPDTSLLTLPDFVPAGFRQGIEILNDDVTPMRFVTSVLAASLGLSREDADRAMLDIHMRGGRLFPTASFDDAQRIAAEITAEAAKQGYPLVCRPVGGT